MLEQPPKLKKIIVALDNMNESQINDFLGQHYKVFSIVKIGMEAFYAGGRELVKKIARDYQVQIFLDLKLHDIPNTVAKAITSLEGLPIKFLTLHLSGGEQMLKAAKAAQEKHLPKTKLLGVSYLTSLDEKDFLSIWGVEKSQIHAQFKKLFKLAHDSKIHGIVCSAHEVSLLKEFKEVSDNQSLEVVCPGIRFSDEIHSDLASDDQKRVMTPHEAFQHGADYLVMGRSLTMAKNFNSRSKELFEVEKNV